MHINRFFIQLLLVATLLSLGAWNSFRENAGTEADVLPPYLPGKSPKALSGPPALSFLPASYAPQAADMPPLRVLGTWNGNGLPGYLVSNTPVAIEASFQADIMLSLPEYQSVMTTHPEYLQTSSPTTITVKELADVWITFVNEGAGWFNTLGYYTFDAANPPTSADQIQNPTVIFPNVSRVGSSGPLQPGHRVKLGRFPGGTNIGFFLMADAFRNGTIGKGRYVHFSHDILNVEPDPKLRRHVVILDDSHSDRILLSMEDIRRDSTGCDQDFNDAIFYLTSNPVKSIQDPTIPRLETNVPKPCRPVCVPVKITRRR